MKVIIPLDEDQKMICPVFGRAPYFGILSLIHIYSESGSSGDSSYAS